MDNPETLAIQNGQSRDTGNPEWTIQRHWQYRMDNPETLAIQNGQSRDTGNPEWTIQRHWQYRAQDTEQRQTKQKDTTKK
jgi:hypothetical protein